LEAPPALTLSMLMPDVNILVYAHRADTREHVEHAEWLSELAAGDEPFALSELVLQGFVRVVTNPRILARPSTLDEAFAFVDELRRRPTCHLVRPGPRHWSIFDTDFARFPGLRWRLPHRP